MVGKGFEVLKSIQPKVEAIHKNKLLERRKALFEDFLQLYKIYEIDPASYKRAREEIKATIAEVEPLFSEDSVSEAGIKTIERQLGHLKLLFTPSEVTEVSVNKDENPTEAQTPVAPTPLILQMSDMVKPAPEAIMAAVPESSEMLPTDTVEQMKNSLEALDTEIGALTETWTVPVYEVLKAEDFLEHPVVRRIYGKEGNGGLLVAAFDQCALAREFFVQKLREAEGGESNAELKTLYRRFVKQVAVLKKKVAWHMTTIQNILDAEDLAAPSVGTTEVQVSNTAVTSPEMSADTATTPLVLTNELRAGDEQKAAHGLTMVSLPEPEKLELAEVHRMEEVVARIEAETAALQKLSSWRGASEAGNVTAMVDQFKRTIVNYYVQPSPALFERLQNTLGTIETLHREAKEAGVDVLGMLAEVETFERDLPRLERLPSTNPFERSNLRAFIENFRGLYARYIRAEAGEEKNILLRELAKMYSNITAAHKDAVTSVLEKPVTELDSLKQEVETLLNDESLPKQSREALSIVETEMLTRLGLLMPGDALYNQLLEKVKETVTSAKQLNEAIPTNSVAVTSETIENSDSNIEPININVTTTETSTDATPIVLDESKLTPVNSPQFIRIEGAANHYLAPEIKKKLTSNRQLAAALLLVTASVFNPNDLSSYSENAQVASADISSTLKELGIEAKWSGESPDTAPVAVDEVTKEEVRIPVVPYTSKVAANESITTPQANSADVSPTVDTSEPVSVNTVAVEPDPKSPAYQESIAPIESVASGNTVVEVLEGDESTYPDRAINSFLATVDATGIPEVLANKLRAEEKEAFLSDANRLKAAGVGSGQSGATFPGEKINYYDPVQRLERRFNEYRQYLNVPHTEVAETGDTRTSLAFESYARDLQLIPKADQLNLVSAAVEAYYATPEGRETLNGEDKDTLKPGTIVPLKGVAPFLATEIANYVRKTVTAAKAESGVDTLVETGDESGSASEVIMDEVTSAESYPGGILEYSKAYNAKLESLGIAPTAPSMIDSWFQPRTTDNRALLEMTVGELTKIMMQAPLQVAEELASRKVSLESANKMYELIIKARAEGQAPYDIDSALTGADIIQAQVFKEALKSRN